MQCQVIVKGPREGQFLPFAKNVRRGLLAAATIHRVQILSEGVCMPRLFVYFKSTLLVLINNSNTPAEAFQT